jgi:septal ring factor EnvC (AmiA/AmiB activator)
MNTTQVRKTVLVWYIKFTAVLMFLWILLFLVPIVFGAEPQSIDNLLKERATVRQALTELTKNFETNREKFNAQQTTKDFIAKQAELQKTAQESNRRLMEIDTLIAERVAKEKELKK